MLPPVAIAISRLACSSREPRALFSPRIELQEYEGNVGGLMFCRMEERFVKKILSLLGSPSPIGIHCLLLLSQFQVVDFFLRK